MGAGVAKAQPAMSLCIILPVSCHLYLYPSGETGMGWNRSE